MSHKEGKERQPVRGLASANGGAPGGGRACLSGRRPTREVRIGGVAIGGGNPVEVQTMTDCDTSDTMACATQIERIRRTGCRIVRLTTRTEAEARNLGAIREELHRRGVCDVALAADVHFNADIALTAAAYADKVRINPGNFRDPDGSRLSALLRECRRRGVSLRIGVNHGSLSQGIVERFGDTPRGMVESAMEMLRRCRAEGFGQVVVSMKSSNARVMAHAYRLLAAEMEREGMDYPLHLGVTEAGDGPQGRIKSAVGIAALLADGIGDTLRVSLTEPPENEIPVAEAIAGLFADVDSRNAGVSAPPCEYRRRNAGRAGNMGGGDVPLLYGELDAEALRAVSEGRVAVLEAATENPALEWREKIDEMDAAGDCRPVVLHRIYGETSADTLRLKIAAHFGPPLLDGLADAVWIENRSPEADGGGERIENRHPAATDGERIDRTMLDSTALAVMQAARARISAVEYISCPGCGRTLFDLHATLARVKARTAHLRPLRIGVMGCIVNGPGEMADADYGYVGAGPGLVTLYKGKEPVRRNVPEDEAVEALVGLLRENGDWQETE